MQPPTQREVLPPTWRLWGMVPATHAAAGQVPNTLACSMIRWEAPDAHPEPGAPKMSINLLSSLIVQLPVQLRKKINKAAKKGPARNLWLLPHPLFQAPDRTTIALFQMRLSGPA